MSAGRNRCVEHVASSFGILALKDSSTLAQGTCPRTNESFYARSLSRSRLEIYSALLGQLMQYFPFDPGQIRHVIQSACRYLEFVVVQELFSKLPNNMAIYDALRSQEGVWYQMNDNALIKRNLRSHKERQSCIAFMHAQFPDRTTWFTTSGWLRI
ncbi:hypothetical protein EV356DRAFT_514752 [Viridothelium virens]|uniref:Uncharacterized protein n=1 Tax=Viridothelium virens TaxID=1048519 RepID=A0A6A6HAM5_VIRVR|nr:hypothetical protein EV356DRAFT_514752 [Viridothelium virens]